MKTRDKVGFALFVFVMLVVTVNVAIFSLGHVKADPVSLYLEDGSHTFLGNILYASHSGNNVNYVTYLPGIDGIIQLVQSGDHMYLDNSHMENDSNFYYTETGCVGTPYAEADEGYHNYPWIDHSDSYSTYFAVSSSTLSTTTLSHGSIGSCIDEPGTHNVNEMIPVTLPFSSFTPPFTIH